MHGGAADRSGLIAVGDEVGVMIMMVMMMMMTMMVVVVVIGGQCDVWGDEGSKPNGLQSPENGSPSVQISYQIAIAQWIFSSLKDVVQSQNVTAMME